jgi:hypothetical protein
MKVALLGFEQAGKKTFFTLLTGRKIPGALKEDESVEGVAPIRDPRVDVLAGICKPERKKYAENTLVLCPTIKEGAASRPWLEAARKCDLVCLVVRDFTADEVYHPAGSVNAERDRSALESELLLADLELIEKRLDRMQKEKKGGQTSREAHEEQVLTHLKTTLEKDMRFVSVSLEPQDLDAIKSLGLLTLKPILWAMNVDEGKLQGPALPTGVFRVSCRIEQEIMALESEEERAEYLRSLGMESSGLDRLNQAAYDAMGLMSFYTIGEDEVRAWTIRKGTPAPQAAGKVHTDIERGFIRAEIIKYDDLVAAGSEAAAKAAGKHQVKGRDYVIEDGDICHFRFNV